MVGISPHPAVIYISRAWGGRASDKYITQSSTDLLDSLNKGDVVMTDRGFDVFSTFTPLGVNVLKGRDRSQLKKEEGKSSEIIAEARIHVERAIRRIKTFHILDNEVRLSMAHLADQIFTVCAYLINFQSPIIAGQVNTGGS